MPQGFTFYPDALAMWTLITPDSEIARDPESANVGVFGLLKPGVTIERAQKEVELELLTEGLVLSLAGAVVGILLAMAAVHYFRTLNPIEMPPGNPVTVNFQVLGFTGALVILTALVFGLVPALKASRLDLIDALRASARVHLSARRLGSSEMSW